MRVITPRNGMREVSTKPSVYRLATLSDAEIDNALGYIPSQQRQAVQQAQKLGWFKRSNKGGK